MEADARKYFRIHNKWVEIDSRDDPDHKKSNDPTSNRELDIFICCLEYWDEIKDKYKYKHELKKRVLKIKQEEWKNIANDTKKVEQLFKTRGEIKSIYQDQTKSVGVRGKGVKSTLSGNPKKLETPELQLISLSSSKTEIEQPPDILEDIKQCLGINDLNNVNQEVFKSNENNANQYQDDRRETTSKAECTHFKKNERKKLFTVPECHEISTTTEETVSLTPFEKCFHQLHKLEKEPHIKEEEENNPSIIKEEEDFWCRLQKYQIKKYGYADKSFRKSSNITLMKQREERLVNDEDFIKMILDHFMERDIIFKGNKVTIKEFLGDKNVVDVFKKVKSVSVTQRDEDGTLIEALDLRKENIKSELGFEVKSILEKLIGEWTTLGNFLRQLALNSNENSSKDSLTRRKLEGGRVLGTLGSKIQEIVQNIIDEKFNQDTEFKIKYSTSYRPNCQIPMTNKTMSSSAKTERIVKLHYREKTIADDKNEKLATRREFIIGSETESLKSEVNNEKDSPQERLKSFSDCTTTGQDIKCTKRTCNNLDYDRKDISHRGVVELMSGAKYIGSWNHLGMHGCGIYISPGGTMIEGYMNDGVFDGPACVYLPNGIIINCGFDKGKFHSPTIKFGDGLDYKHRKWSYLNNDKEKEKNEEKQTKCILNRKIPQGCYDTGEGFYDPNTRLIHHPVTMKPIRSVSEREEKWIISICAAESPDCVSLDQHLYELVDLQKNDGKQSYSELLDELPEYDGCKIATNPEQKDTSTSTSPDRLIETNEKSRPAEELWNSIIMVTGNIKAQVAVPFSFERSMKYTCYDQIKKGTNFESDEDN